MEKSLITLILKRAAIVLAALSFILVVSCRGATYYDKHPIVLPVYLDASFSPDEKADIVEGINEWNRFLNGQEILQIEDRPLTDEIKELQRHQLLIERADVSEAEEHVLGWTDDICSQEVHLVVERTKPNYNLTILTEHEIGHALCLNHTPINHTLMSRFIEYQDVCGIDAATGQQFAETHPWFDSNKFKPCE